jgi:hypothetical protein
MRERTEPHTLTEPRTRRRRYRRPRPTEWGETVPTLATLAAPHGLRVYRDACGDENLPGRFGEIFRHGPDCLAVQFGGVRANGTQTDDLRKMRWRMRQAKRTQGLRRIMVGREEALFHFPDALLLTVAHLIGAYAAYRGIRKSVPLADAV